jgi:hypothetical protein
MFQGTYNDNDADDNSKMQKSNFPISAYQPFGELDKTFQSEGWYPESTSQGQTTYRSGYNNAFNDVQVDANNKGHIALIGNKNGLFDIVIRDNQGNSKLTIAKQVSPNDVHTWVTKQGSLVDQRQNKVAMVTPPTVTNQLPMGSNIF